MMLLVVGQLPSCYGSTRVLNTELKHPQWGNDSAGSSTVCYGNSPCSRGKTSTNGPFSIAMWKKKYRVIHIHPIINLCEWMLSIVSIYITLKPTNSNTSILIWSCLKIGHPRFQWIIRSNPIIYDYMIMIFPFDMAIFG